MLRNLARWCYGHRRVVLAIWLLVLVACIVLSKTVGSAYSESLRLPGTESQKAADLLDADFRSRSGDSGQLVFAATNVRSADVRSRVGALVAQIEKVPGIVDVESPYTAAGARQISNDGTVAYATIDFALSSDQIHQLTTDRIVHDTEAARAPDLRFELGGQMFETGGVPSGTAAIGLLAAAVILLLTFGSMLAMGLPITIALFGVGTGLSLVAVLSRVLSTPDFTSELASMIGIGVGIDYALFIVTRFRQGMHDGLEPEPAVVLAIDTAGRAVLFAGVTVVISLFGLFLMGVEFVRGLAVGASLTVALVMFASVTLLPALLGFAGHAIDKFSVPGRRRRENAHRKSMWFTWSRIVQRRPWPAAIGGLAVLVILAVPLLGMHLGFNDAGNDAKSTTTRQAYDLLAHGFGPGFNGPLILAAKLEPRGNVADLAPLVSALQHTPGVKTTSPAVPSPSGEAAVIQVIPSSSPQSQQTVSLIHDLRKNVIPDALGTSADQVYVGGFTASGVDVSDQFSKRLPLFIGAVLLLSFLLLLAVFRSLLVPLKAVVMNLLSIGASYGVVVTVFQHGHFGSLIGSNGTGPIAPFIPMMLFAIVFGLSMDYEVFLLSRIREEYDRTGDNALAVADGLAATARVITAAALIMITVFASFIFGDLQIVKLFGLGLAFAIFIDASVVRMVLVPATMELLGSANWWFPKWLDRIVPRLHVEAVVDVDAELAELLDEQEATRS
ncbi:MAG TPA: MMPL family transporter [Acidimicrobiia bacterium]|jgi:RND superfamily putative drug exporter|nr:MMPL family transporter [Acidimicrobiia bacterium]